jgi:two-component system NarL family sensor kinase
MSEPPRQTIQTLIILKSIAETLNRGVGLYETLATTLPLVVDLLNLHTGWLFLRDASGRYALAAHHSLPPALGFPGPAWRGVCNCQTLAQRGELLPSSQVVQCSRLYDARGDRRGLAWHASVPLAEDGALIGILNVATSQWDQFSPQDLQLFSAVGYQLATAIVRMRLAEQATRIALVEERNRLAREVHDTLAQELAGITLQLEAADALLDTAPERARARVRNALERTRASLAEARRSVLALRAGPLAHQELHEALAELAQRFQEDSGISVAQSLVAIAPSNSAEALYRIAQEALANVRKHANARHVRLELRNDESQALLIIEDDGCGFDVEQQPQRAPSEGGFGLTSMRERAHLAGGSLLIHSAPSSGTRVEARVPL